MPAVASVKHGFLTLENDTKFSIHSFRIADIVVVNFAFRETFLAKGSVFEHFIEFTFRSGNIKYVKLVNCTREEVKEIVKKVIKLVAEAVEVEREVLFEGDIICNHAMDAGY